MDLLAHLPEDLLRDKVLPLLDLKGIARIGSAVGTECFQNMVTAAVTGRTIPKLVVTSDTSQLMWMNKREVCATRIVFHSDAEISSLDLLLDSKLCHSLSEVEFTCRGSNVSTAALIHDYMLGTYRAFVNDRSRAQNFAVLFKRMNICFLNVLPVRIPDA